MQNTPSRTAADRGDIDDLIFADCEYTVSER